MSIGLYYYLFLLSTFSLIYRRRRCCACGLHVVHHIMDQISSPMLWCGDQVWSFSMQSMPRMLRQCSCCEINFCWCEIWFQDIAIDAFKSNAVYWVVSSARAISSVPWSPVQFAEDPSLFSHAFGRRSISFLLQSTVSCRIQSCYGTLFNWADFKPDPVRFSSTRTADLLSISRQRYVVRLGLWTNFCLTNQRIPMAEHWKMREWRTRVQVGTYSSLLSSKYGCSHQRHDKNAIELAFIIHNRRDASIIDRSCGSMDKTKSIGLNTALYPSNIRGSHNQSTP